MRELKVFVGYRRDDTQGWADRIHDWLAPRLGAHHVFQDVDARIPPGTPFEPFILQTLRECDVFLAVIGRRWLTERLRHPDDWVRKEIELALGLPGIRVVPLLVNEARPPGAQDLPPSIRGLAALQAQTVRRNPDFPSDMERLLVGLQRPVAPGPRGTRVMDCAGEPLELTWVPPAERFLMGASTTPGPGYDAEAYDWEGPVRRVTLTRGFWMGRHPVTVAQYRAFCAATGHRRSPALDNPGLSGDRMPITHVDVDDARAMARWVHTADGAAGDLPTEAEWEWAARGPDARRYPWGAAPPTAERAHFMTAFGVPDALWTDLDEAAKRRLGDGTPAPAPAPVGGRPSGRGPFGNEDLAGNVWEWCVDTWAERQQADTIDPVCRQGDTESHRVVRGGSWSLPSWSLRSAYRLRNLPGSRGGDLGFRVVLRPASLLEP